MLLTLSLDITYKSHLTNLNKEAAIKYENNHLEIFCNRRSSDLTRNWPRTLSNFITCSESQLEFIKDFTKKISQVLSKVQSQSFIQCHITFIKFIHWKSASGLIHNKSSNCHVIILKRLQILLQKYRIAIARNFLKWIPPYIMEIPGMILKTNKQSKVWNNKCKNYIRLKWRKKRPWL